MDIIEVGVPSGFKAIPKAFTFSNLITKTYLRFIRSLVFEKRANKRVRGYRIDQKARRSCWKSEKLRLEKEGIGFYITGHPLEKYIYDLRKFTTTTTTTVSHCRDGEQITIGGVVTSFRKKLTKKGDQMGFFRLEDLEGAIEVILVPKVFQKYSQLLTEDLPVLAKGYVTVSEEELPKLRVDMLKPLSLTTSSGEQYLIELRAARLRKQTVHQLQQLLLQHHGDCPVMFKYVDSDNTITRIKAGPRFTVLPSKQLKQHLEMLIGENAVFLSS